MVSGPTEPNSSTVPSRRIGYELVRDAAARAALVVHSHHRLANVLAQLFG